MQNGAEARKGKCPMKTQWLLLTAVCLLVAGSALAQHILTPKLTAHVPFEFVVNGNEFPKGDYIVSAFNDGRKLKIQHNTQPEYSAFIFNNEVSLGGDHDNEGKMIFLLTNGQHVLHQISFRDDNHIHDILHEGPDAIELVAVRESLK
jgi:hypothetical protein